MSTNAVNVTASVDDVNAPVVDIQISLEGLEAEDDVYVYATFAGSAVSMVDSYATSDSSAVMNLAMIPPGSLEPGVYHDTVTLEFCEDTDCRKQYKGSPATVAITYTVTASTRPPATLSTPSDQLDVTVEVNQGGGSGSLPITITNPPDAGTNLSLTYASSTAISSAYASMSNNTTGVVQVSFNYGLAEGTYRDTLTLTACYDYSCTRHLQGSPKQIAVTYTVTPRQPAAPDRPLLPTASVKPLPHDVVDAEFSAALNAVVMVSAVPSNALYLYSLADSSELKLALDKPPTSVSVAPDGKTAAVGQDALVSHVDLTQLATAPLSAKKLLNLSTQAGDLVLDGKGWVDVFPASDQWVEIHAIKVATNVETLVSASVYAGTRAKLHPSGNSLYVTDFDRLAKYDISAGAPAYLYGSTYYSGYPSCADLWISEEGDNIYTACGYVFRATATQSSDMLYAGSMQLTAPAPGSYYSYYRIGSLSQSAEKKEIAIVESDVGCESSDPYTCRDYYGLFESQFFNRSATYSIPPMTVDGRAYVQRGLFTFHNSDGSQRVLISRLLNMSDAAKTYYLSVLN